RWPGRRHPGPLRPSGEPSRPRLFRVTEFHHFPAVRWHADPVGTDSRRRALDRLAGAAALHQRVPPDSLRAHYRGGRSAPPGGAVDACAPGEGVEVSGAYAAAGPFHRRYRRGPRLATTPLRIAAIAASGSGKDRGAIAPGLSALLCEH